ncbi:MAG: RNA polymerase sigma factor [Bacteroidota bacterium]|nr:RNA polymerase sigma factor [Bacteroidota bacterium]
MTEAELVRKCQKGNRQAQHDLFQTYADRFYRLMFRYVRTQHDAEDLVMVAFAKIFNHIPTFVLKDNGGLEAWMRRIMVNEALMLLRKKHNLNLTETLDVLNPEHDQAGWHLAESEDLYNMIVALPPGYRTVFNLFVVEGYDHREIAEMLGISENTSRSQLFKAKQLLKRKIEQEGMRYGT